MTIHVDGADADRTAVPLAHTGEELVEDVLDRPVLVFDHGNVFFAEGTPQELLDLADRVDAAVATLRSHSGTHRFVVTVVSDDPATETIVRRLAADLTEQVDTHTPLLVRVHRQR